MLLYTIQYTVLYNTNDVTSIAIVRTLIQSPGKETNLVHPDHRRRIETEGKAKVVPSVWGAEFVQFLSELAILPQSIWKNGMNSTFLPNRLRQNS